ncbi:hypothetical protein [Actinacidiphila sp. bgisy160]|uniref:hypothetical protein n=1 Tax=Actinacidiphila sp. bgisy160 TaxID=3413796 RepID=UPI003D71C584
MSGTTSTAGRLGYGELTGKTHVNIACPPGAPVSAGSARMTPTDLVARFERLAMPLLARVYAAAAHMTPDRSAAETLVQQTYVRAYEEFGMCTGVNLKAWLLRLLADTARGTHDRRQDPPHSDRENALSRHQPPERRRPELPAARDLLLLPDRKVAEALHRLPQDTALVMHLAHAEEFTPQEIAEILRIPQAVVISRLRHGHRRILQLLTGAVSEALPR